MFLYKTQSSAKRRTDDLIFSGRYAILFSKLSSFWRHILLKKVKKKKKKAAASKKQLIYKLLDPGYFLGKDDIRFKSFFLTYF